MARLVEVGGAPVNRAERDVVARLVRDLPEAWHVIPNVDIHDGRSGHAYECDAIVVGPPGVCIVEIKGWRGTIRSRTHADWQLDDGKFVSNPLKVTDHKARVLASHVKSLHLRHGMQPPYVSACVVVDDPRAAFEVFPPENDRCLRIDTAGAWLTSPGKLGSPRGTTENYARFVSRISDHIVGRLRKRADTARTYGNYRTTARVGGDDESSVWLARHAHLDDGRVYRVRTWFLSPYLYDEREVARRKKVLQRAAEALSRIGDHPNVAQLRDFGEQEGEFYEVTDWSESGTLATAHSGGQLAKLDVQARLTILRGLLGGVQAGVENGVVHRDIRPAAILLDPDGTPRITEYDRAFVAEVEGTVSGHSPLQGNPYRPPELRAPGRHAATEASDVYSIAAIALDVLGTEGFDACLVQALRDATIDDPDSRRASVEELLTKTEPPQAAATPRFELAPGARIDGNTLVEELGAGRDGRVFRVRNDLLQADYALKVLDPPPPGDDPLAAWRHAKAVRSRHLRAVHWVGALPDGSGRPYVLLELLQGQTLRQRLDSGPPPTLEEVTGWATDLLDALAALHPSDEAPGLIHRDVKPANVLITSRGAVLVDLSLATPGGSAGAAPIGSPHYHPPDLAGAGWGPHADLFALGCLVYEALAGEHPWGASLPSATQRPRPLDNLRSGVPEALAGVIARALEPAAEDRFARAEGMADALAEARSLVAEPPPSRTDLGRLASEAADELWSAGQVQDLVERDSPVVPLFGAMRRCVVPASDPSAEARQESLLATAARLQALEGPLPELMPSLYDELLIAAPGRPEDDAGNQPTALAAQAGDLVLLVGGLHTSEWAVIDRRLRTRSPTNALWVFGLDPTVSKGDDGTAAIHGLDDRRLLPVEEVAGTDELQTSLVLLDLPRGDRREEDLPSLLLRRSEKLGEALDLVELHPGRSWVIATSGVIYLGHGLRTDVAEGLARPDDARARWTTAFGAERSAAPSQKLPASLDRPTRQGGGRTFAIGRLAWPCASETTWLQAGGLSLPERLLPIWFAPASTPERP